MLKGIDPQGARVLISRDEMIRTHQDASIALFGSLSFQIIRNLELCLAHHF